MADMVAHRAVKGVLEFEFKTVIGIHLMGRPDKVCVFIDASGNEFFCLSDLLEVVEAEEILSDNLSREGSRLRKRLYSAPGSQLSGHVLCVRCKDEQLHMRVYDVAPIKFALIYMQSYIDNMAATSSVNHRKIHAETTVKALKSIAAKVW